ncbi:MAG TPA: hypothetical protein VG275_01740 [Solirubrobacteraceae bacterium]|nr:hypothetical protein [Solirubrobacteraceae bacterium]
MSHGPPAEIRSFSFGDPAGELVGTASAWAGGFCSSFGGPFEVEGSDPGEEWRLTGDGFELTFAPVGEPGELELADAGISALYQLAHVRGTVTIDGEARAVDGAGQRSRRMGAPDGKRFGSLRAVSGWFGEEDGLALLAVRPRRARGHDSELLAAVLIEGGVAVRVTEPRLSSTYTSDGAPARVGLELWIGEEDAEQYPRRAAGETLGRSLLCDDSLRAELLRLRMRGREGTGLYELVQSRQ